MLVNIALPCRIIVLKDHPLCYPDVSWCWQKFSEDKIIERKSHRLTLMVPDRHLMSTQITVPSPGQLVREPQRDGSAALAGGGTLIFLFRSPIEIE